MPGRRYDYELILATNLQNWGPCRITEPCHQHKHCVLVEFLGAKNKPRDPRNATPPPTHIQFDNLRKRTTP